MRLLLVAALLAGFASTALAGQPAPPVVQTIPPCIGGQCPIPTPAPLYIQAPRWTPRIVLDQSWVQIPIHPPQIGTLSTNPCPTCQGGGVQQSAEGAATAPRRVGLLRRILGR